MPTIKVEVECSKELFEAGDGVAKLVKAVKKAIADGWQPLTDIPAVVVSAVNDLAPGLVGLEKAKGEWETQKEASINAVTVTGSKVVGALLG